MIRTTLLALVTFASGLLAAPPAANAQHQTKIPRIGFLGTGSPSDAGFYVGAFRQALGELAYVEGQNISIEYRWGEGGFDQFLDFGSDLVRGNVDLILAWGATAAAAAAQSTKNIPVVFVAIGDPVGAGLVASLARPGGNITGLSNISADLMVKQVELLKEVIPKATRLAALRNPANPASGLQARETEVAARSLRIKLQVVEVRAPNEFRSAFAAMTRARADGFLVLPDPMFVSHRARIAELAAKNRLPAMFNLRQYAEAGGLMAYGASLPDMFRRAATYVDKILKGAKPADLPVEQPTKFELVINTKTAKALGLTIPRSVLGLADEVIP